MTVSVHPISACFHVEGLITLLKKLPALALVLLFFSGFGLLRAQEAAGLPNAVLIDRFLFRYGLDHPQLPSLEELRAIKLSLRKNAGIWRKTEGREGEILTLGQLPAGSQFDGEALKAVAQAIVNWFNARGFSGVWVAFTDLEATGPTLTDNRASGEHSAQIVIWASQVSEVRTLARGSRFKPEESINNRKHQRIAHGSPLQGSVSAEKPGDLFRQGVVERYLADLSTQPGRRVEASIASAGAPGKVVLDYLVTEIKPWMVIAQASNTGTAATDRWRGRLGFQHNQLTNHDDVLNLDAISTPDFSSYGTFGSYRLPLLPPATLVGRVFGSYGDFLANDATLQTLRFGGKNWLTGGELSNRSVFLRHWEINSVAGAAYTHYEVQSEVAGTSLSKGSAEFLIPYLGTNLSRDSEWWSIGGGVRIDHTVSSRSRTSAAGITTLGRIGADEEWTSLRWNLGGSTYLDPLFNKSEQTSALAHELSFRVRGRVLLRGHRLIPQEEEPLGGALSVRGYPEAILSADEFILATAEYAFHLPRSFKPGERKKLFGRPFSWRPPQPNQRADWDLIFRGFFDYGYRWVSPGPAGSSGLNSSALIDRDLGFAGAGGGVELVLWRNVSLRCDVGTALTELRDQSLAPGDQVVVRSGSVRVHFVSSISW